MYFSQASFALENDEIFVVGYYRKFFGTTILANRTGA
jgi:hypothetical protein